VDVFTDCGFVGHPGGEIVDARLGPRILVADFPELTSDDVKLDGDGHYARDGSPENVEGGALGSRDRLEDVGGEVLH